jgi:hypothetical protein
LEVSQGTDESNRMAAINNPCSIHRHEEAGHASFQEWPERSDGLSSQDRPSQDCQGRIIGSIGNRQDYRPITGGGISAEISSPFFVWGKIMVLDAYVIRKLQDLYLWIYDWTGIYVATIGTIAVILGNLTQGMFGLSGLSWWNLTWIGFNTLVMIPYYLDQDHENYILFNARAMILQCSKLRIIISYFFVVMFISDILLWIMVPTYSFSHMVNTFCLWVYINITSVCIREREPKDWFKSPKVAMEST